MSGYNKKKNKNKQNNQRHDTQQPQENKQKLNEELEPVEAAEEPELEETSVAEEPTYEPEGEPDQNVSDIWKAMHGGAAGGQPPMSSFVQSIRSMASEEGEDPSLGYGEVEPEPEVPAEVPVWEPELPKEDAGGGWGYTEEPSFLNGDTPVTADAEGDPTEEPNRSPFDRPLGEDQTFRAAYDAAKADPVPDRDDLYEPNTWGEEEVEPEPAPMTGTPEPGYVPEEPPVMGAPMPDYIPEESPGFTAEPGSDGWAGYPQTDPFAEPAVAEDFSGEGPESVTEPSEDEMFPGEQNWFDMVPQAQPRADAYVSQEQPPVEPGASEEEFEQYQASDEEDEDYEEEAEDDGPESEEAVEFKQKLASGKRGKKGKAMKPKKKKRRRNPEAERKKNSLIKTIVAVLFCVVVIISQFDRIGKANALIGTTTLPDPQPSQAQPVPTENPSPAPNPEATKEIADFRYIDVGKLNKMTASELAAWFTQAFRTGGVWNEEAYKEYEIWYGKKAELDSEFDLAYRNALNSITPEEITPEQPTQKPAEPEQTPTPSPITTPSATPTPKPSSQYKYIDGEFLDGAAEADVANWVYETFPVSASVWDTNKYNEYKSWLAEKRKESPAFVEKVDSYLSIMGWTDRT